MQKKQFWGIALAFLLAAVLITGHPTLSAKDDTAEENMEQEQTVEEKATESEKQETEEVTEIQDTSEAMKDDKNQEESSETPKIGGGGSQNHSSKGV